MARSAQLTTWMRAAGESSRLRLLALCSQSELSVSDLGRALGQSGPRVSRHLKILCEAGLLQRVRHGQWVHYRITEAGEAGDFLRGLLAQLDRTDGTLAHDRQRARLADAGAQGAPASRLGRTLQAVIEERSPARGLGSALLVGLQHLELLEAVAARADTCLCIAPTQRAALATERFAAERGLACQVRLGAGLNALREEHDRDAVILEALTTPSGALPTVLTAASAALAPAGKLWLFVRYEEFEQPGGALNPLLALRTLLAAAGFEGVQLSPLEADGEHVLAAHASLARAARGAAAAPPAPLAALAPRRS